MFPESRVLSVYFGMMLVNCSQSLKHVLKMEDVSSIRCILEEYVSFGSHQRRMNKDDASNELMDDASVMSKEEKGVEEMIHYLRAL